MKLRPVIQTLDYPVIVVDDQDRIVDWNPAAEHAFTVPANKVQGRRVQEILQAHDIFGNPVCTHGCFLHEIARRGEVPFGCEWDLHGLVSGSQRFHVDFETLKDSPRGHALVYHLRPDRRNVRRRTDSLGVSAARTESSVAHSARMARLASLTPREVEVLRLVGRGAGTAQIARTFGISTVTVRNHIERMLQKLGAHSRVEAVSIAHQSRFL